MALTITLNGETRELAGPQSVRGLLMSLGLDPAKIAVERNLQIVPRSTYDQVEVGDGDRLEIVHFIGGGNAPAERRPAKGGAGEAREPVLRPDARPNNEAVPKVDRPFVLAGKTYKSRLIIGTGKYKTYEDNARALEASGAEIVTVAVRRVNLTDPSQPKLVDFIDPRKVTYLPNTAGCFTGEDAVRTLRLAREAGGWNLVKLEVLGEKKLLYPDMLETLRATEMLTKDGFQVMVYCSDDPLMAKRLEEVGAVAIMPLASPIGSGMGLQATVNIRMIIEDAKVPVIVDAGIGTASDAAIAMELGCDAVISNTGIAHAKDPVKMAAAMKLAVEAGRLAWLAGRMPKKAYADPSSPLSGLI
jgi:thiazole synthase